MHLNDYSIMIKIKCVGHDQSNTTHGLTGCLLFLLSPAHSQRLEVPKTPFFFFFSRSFLDFHMNTLSSAKAGAVFISHGRFCVFLSALFLAGLKWVGLILERKNVGMSCIFEHQSGFRKKKI